MNPNIDRQIFLKNLKHKLYNINRGNICTLPKFIYKAAFSWHLGKILVFPERILLVLTICRTEASSCRYHRERGTAVQWADVVHVGANVWMWGVKGRLRPHWRVPVWRDPDEGDIRKSWAGRQCRRPGIKEKEKHLSTLWVFFIPSVFLHSFSCEMFQVSAFICKMSC